MDRVLWFFNNVKVKPINNRAGHTTTIYDHFMNEDEKTRLDRDTKSKEVSEGLAHRVISFRFMPQILKTDENLAMVNEYYCHVAQFLRLAERSTKPCRCCCQRRTSCGCCFVSLFGEVK